MEKIRNNQKMNDFFVKPKNELKTKKMRAEMCYRLVSGFLSYDQFWGVNVQNTVNMFFSIS